MSSPVAAYSAYEARKRTLLDQYRTIPMGAPVRLAKKTSNLFRTREASTTPGLAVNDFQGVLAVDVERRTADVQGMTTYGQLVDATLPHGLMPLVVPQLKTITLGGAVTGLGIESSSYRNGFPHESVIEMEIMTGGGEIVVAAADNDHAALFHAFPNSYGTLGYALRLKIELEPVKPYVHVEHLRFRDATSYFTAMRDVCATGHYNDKKIDFVDGVSFGSDELYLSIGRFVDEAPYVNDYTGMQIYYRSLQQRPQDYLTVRGYLWRWDTDWFWCSKATGVQNPLIRRLVPKRYLRSDVYWKIINFERKHRYVGRMQARMGKPAQELVIQDIEVPVEHAGEYLAFMNREVDLNPVWICPIIQRDKDATWDLYTLDANELYINFGFWGSVALQPGESPETHNRLVEAEVTRLGGRKSLYSSVHYDEDQFWRLYNREAYESAKRTYDPDERLLDLYSKTVRAK